MRARPYFQQLYASRVTLYRDALQQFLQGYREGFSSEQGKSSFTEPGKRFWKHCMCAEITQIANCCLKAVPNCLACIMTANMPVLPAIATDSRWRTWCRVRLCTAI